MPKREKIEAFTLSEMLVALGLVVLLAVIAIPSFGMMKSTSARKCSLGSVMGVLSTARTLAISGKRESWVVFRREGDRILMRMVLGGPQGMVPSGNWIALPSGIGIQDENGTLSAQPLSDALLSSAGAQRTSVIGGIGFLPSGKISSTGRPGGQLSLNLTDARGEPSGSLLLSRATGLASIP